MELVLEIVMSGSSVSGTNNTVEVNTTAPMAVAAATLITGGSRMFPCASQEMSSG